MANVTVSGVVTGRPGESPVVFKTFDSGDMVASFSIADLEYVYAKKDEDRQGQFYRVEVRGKAAQIAADRLQRGSKVAIHGQLVQREYQGKNLPGRQVCPSDLSGTTPRGRSWRRRLLKKCYRGSKPTFLCYTTAVEEPL